MDFPLVLIELFSLGVTAEALRANIGWKSAISLQRGPVDPNFQVEGVTPTNHSSQKTRLNYLSYDIKIWTDLSSILSQITRLTDGRTDRQTEFSSLDRVCIPCSAVMISSRAQKNNQLYTHTMSDTAKTVMNLPKKRVHLLHVINCQLVDRFRCAYYVWKRYIWYLTCIIEIIMT